MDPFKHSNEKNKVDSKLTCDSKKSVGIEDIRDGALFGKGFQRLKSYIMKTYIHLTNTTIVIYYLLQFSPTVLTLNYRL